MNNVQFKFNFFDDENQENQEQQNKYTFKKDIPQYQINPDKYVDINQLADFNKYRKLCIEIEKSNVSTEEKRFLKFAATRHIVFNYSLIAEYYARASKEMQELMENSALVIIDYDNAIMNGYTMLASEIEKLFEEDYKDD